MSPRSHYFGARHGIDAKDVGKALLDPVVEKAKDVGKVATGGLHVAQGVGKVAQGDFAAGGKQVWEGEQETAEGVKNVYDIRHKDKEPAAEGDGTGDGDASGGDAGSSSDGGSSAAGSGSGGPSSAGSGSEGSASGAPPGGARSRLSDGIPDNEAPGTEGGQDEAERARSAFG